jgi:predicted PurR-regulated permease PerM
LKVEVKVKTIVYALLLVLFGVISIFLFKDFEHALLLIFVSIIAAFTINPVVQIFEKKEFPLVVSVALAYLVVLLFIAGLGYLVVPSALNEVSRVLTEAPGWINHLHGQHTWIGNLDRKLSLDSSLDKLISQAHGKVSPLVSDSIKLVKGVIKLIGEVVIVGFLSALMIVEKRKIDQKIKLAIRDEYIPIYERLALRTRKAIASYITLTGIISFIISIILSSVLLLTGSKLVLLALIILFVIGVIPYFGPLVNCAVMFLFELHNGLPVAVLTLGLTIVFNFIESHILRPYLYGRTIDISPLAVLICIVSFEAAFGLTGALLAIPILVIGDSILIEVIALKLHRRIFKDPVGDSIPPRIKK